MLNKPYFQYRSNRYGINNYIPLKYFKPAPFPLYLMIATLAIPTFLLAIITCLSIILQLFNISIPSFLQDIPMALCCIGFAYICIRITRVNCLFCTRNKEEAKSYIELELKNRELNKERDEIVREIESLGTKIPIKPKEYENVGFEIKEENGWYMVFRKFEQEK